MMLRFALSLSLSAKDLTLHYLLPLGVKSRVTTICLPAWFREAKMAAKAKLDMNERDQRKKGAVSLQTKAYSIRPNALSNRVSAYLVDIPPERQVRSEI